MVEGFTKRYNVHRLVWYELHESMETAITREKRLKNWKRKWKLELIESSNPKWQDLYHRIVWLDSGFRRNDSASKLVLIPVNGKCPYFPRLVARDEPFDCELRVEQFGRVGGTKGGVKGSLPYNCIKDLFLYFFSAPLYHQIWWKRVIWWPECFIPTIPHKPSTLEFITFSDS